MLSIAVSAAMMRPIMPTSTTSRNSSCPRREPMQYFGICFRASLSIHSAGWIFPFSTFITSCFSGHNTLFFLAVSGFCGLHDTIWPFKASPQPTFGTEQTPALRAFVAARGSLRPTRFLLLHVVTSSISLVSSPKGRKLSYFAAPPFPTEPAWPRPPSLGLRQFTLSLGFGGNPDFVLRQLSDTGPNPPKQLWPVSVPAASGKAAHSGSCGETRPCFRSFSATL